ncbi:Transmembrane secretion effector [Bartonella sp. WD12.1]|nr:MFS transporter [Bartonella sp. WD12.1]OPB29000.1 Transmembrane secretion effector [Bartonella sp. WD12.1]
MQKILTLKLFRNSVFRNLWSATLIFNLGVVIQAVGASWLMTLISSSHSWLACSRCYSITALFFL